MRRPVSLMLEGMHDDKIIKNNNKKYENTSLCEPAGSQKEPEKVTTIEEKKLSKSLVLC